MSTDAVAIVTEKPSVARDIAAILGASRRGDGYLHGAGYVVTWAVGHLVTLAEPHQIDPSWRRWRMDTLPMLPAAWPLIVVPATEAQYAVVQRILTSPKIARVICATDAGREGELIFRYIYEKSGSHKPWKRLWISSLTPAAIRDGLSKLRDGRELDPLADAARGRSRADWLVGMNLSRAYSLRDDDELSVGRVQTPTLAMVVERELALRAFVPEPYFEVEATFVRGAASWRGRYFEGKDSDPVKPAQKRLPGDGALAEAIALRVEGRPAEVARVSREDRRTPPPLLYDLTELQRHANRLYGLSAQRTLEAAQRLYEQHKLLSYPRTDSRHLSEAVAAGLGAIVEVIAPAYAGLVPEGTGQRALGRRHVDDSKVTDHHALIPTQVSPQGKRLGDAEQKLYDLVCRRLLMAYCGDHVVSASTILTVVATEAGRDRFVSQGTALVDRGWKALDVGKPDADVDLPNVVRGDVAETEEAKALRKETEPPRRFTEATLLTAMESAGRALDDKELSDAMRERGLGTPATRASILETLLGRAYLVREGKSLVPTDKGLRLIERVHPHVKSPAMTGEWEAELRRMQRGEARLDDFLARVEAWVHEVVGAVRGSDPAGMSPRTPPAGAAVGHPRSPEIGGRLRDPDSAGAVAGDGAPDDDWDDAPLGEPPAMLDAQDGEEDDQGHSGATSYGATRPGGASSGEASFRKAGSRTAADVSYTKESPGQASGGRAARGGAERGRGASSDGPGAESAAAADVSYAKESAPDGVSGRAARDGGVTPELLRAVLAERFGFSRFRPHQEEACLRAAEGRDVLLVMPTGAGKSLCYQLPGIVRGGSTLVVSPLIALMEDQVKKLGAQGFRAARIHQGRDKGEVRDTMAAWRRGALEFLFVAPERLAVRHFLEALTAYPPRLIAIDEAHCISQWGHDFRPEYRMLGQRLPALRPAPILALTATATPRVQSDITALLGMPEPVRLIHGFRRENIAIEVVETLPSLRADKAKELLSDGARRPAIVYAPTRKEAESCAKSLSKGLRVAAYHAGMRPDARDDIQSRFLTGKLDVIVATVAFGMGIDKADVRTVVHTALPGSLEGYYQEIGRAGRDGEPSRAILLYGFVDKKTHEFFLDRDYPSKETMRALYEALPRAPRLRGDVRDEARVAGLDDEDAWDRALSKLWIHGGAVLDEDDRVCRGEDAWEAPYVAVRTHRLTAIEQVLRYAQSGSCKMLSLLRHFGDPDDQRPCGVCQECAPEEAIARALGEATEEESAQVRAILATLRELSGTSAGRLHKEAFPRDELDRRSFEHLLAGMAAAGLVKLEEDSWERDGREIAFTRVHLLDGSGDAVPRVRLVRRPGAKRPRGKKGPSPHTKHVVPKRPARSRPADDDPLVTALKKLRLEEAKRQKVPAFRIFSDKTLAGLARERPSTFDELGAVEGIGPRLQERYGDAILRTIARARG